MLKHGHLGTLPVHLQYHLSSIVPKCFVRGAIKSWGHKWGVESGNEATTCLLFAGDTIARSVELSSPFINYPTHTLIRTHCVHAYNTNCTCTRPSVPDLSCIPEGLLGYEIWV